MCLDNDNNRDINKYSQYKNRHVQFDILINSYEMRLKEKFTEDIKNKLKIDVGDVMYSPKFDFIFYKILSNLKYHKVANEIISLVQQFISHFDYKSIDFDENIRDISDWQFQQLDNNINSKVNSLKKSIKKERKIYENTYFLNEEINKFINEIIMENMNISDGKLLSGIVVTNFFDDEEIQRMMNEYFDSNKFNINEFVPKKFQERVRRNIYDSKKTELRKSFSNFYAAKRTELRNKVKEIYNSKTKEVNLKYREILNRLIDNLAGSATFQIFCT